MNKPNSGNNHRFVLCDLFTYNFHVGIRRTGMRVSTSELYALFAKASDVGSKSASHTSAGFNDKEP